MRILLTTEFSLNFICGVTTAVLNEKNILEALGHEVRILTINDSNKSIYNDGVYYIRKNLPKFYKDSNATIAFSDDILDDVTGWKPEIVHAHNEFFTFVIAKKIAKQLSLPLILTCHTDFPSYGIHFIKSAKVWDGILKRAIPKLVAPTNALLCSSSKIEKLFRNYNVNNAILNIKLGVDLTSFKQPLEESEIIKLKQQFNIAPSDFVLLSICRLSEEKKVDQALQIFSQLHSKHSNLKFLIVGDGDEKEKLKALVKEQGLEDCVTFVGAVKSKDVWKYYKLGDLFLNASESETQGLTFIEALASSVPVVCKKDEVVNNFLIDGYNGFSYSSIDEGVVKCESLLDNAEAITKLKDNCLKSIESFDLEKYGKNLETLFSIAIEEKWKINVPVAKDSKALKLFGSANE